MTGSRQVNRSRQSDEVVRFGRNIPDSLGARVTVSLPHSTLRVDDEGRWSWNRWPRRCSSRVWSRYGHYQVLK